MRRPGANTDSNADSSLAHTVAYCNCNARAANRNADLDSNGNTHAHADRDADTLWLAAGTARAEIPDD